MAGISMFPAHAGMNRLMAMVGVFTPDVPRARGDEPSSSTM